jgi:hypothetical protein
VKVSSVGPGSTFWKLLPQKAPPSPQVLLAQPDVAEVPGSVLSITTSLSAAGVSTPPARVTPWPRPGVMSKLPSRFHWPPPVFWSRLTCVAPPSWLTL